MKENSMKTFVKVPMERVAVIIGQSGITKQTIEEKSSSSLFIDSETGMVEITDSADPLMNLRVAEVIKAIGRGFNPEKAISLLDDDMLILEIIDLKNLAANPGQLKRLLGRIIGKDGKSREVFETMTGCKISVMGKTVSLIGYPDQILIARTGIDMLIKGVSHGPVFSFLEKKRKELKESRW